MPSSIHRITSVPGFRKPIAPISYAVASGHTVYVSGCLGVDGNGKLVSGGAQAQAKKALENMKVVLESAGSSMDKVIKTIVLLSDMKDFQTVNEEYAKWFTTENYPARSCFTVKQLPLGGLVEIEAVAIRSNSKDSNQELTAKL